jgi:hypothetical protein
MAHFFFQKKKAKSVSPASHKPLSTQLSAKPTQGVWGRAPKKIIWGWRTSFSRKRSKKR